MILFKKQLEFPVNEFSLRFLRKGFFAAMVFLFVARSMVVLAAWLG
jgi:hypothetical protein